ncbi:hypothetical protein RB213_011226 [Colletotrichum asianum]
MLLGGPFERLPSSLAPGNPFCVSTRPRLLGLLGYHSSQLIAICVFQGQARSDCPSVPPVLLLRAWHPWSFYSVLARPFVDLDVGLRTHLPTFLFSCQLHLLG